MRLLSAMLWVLLALPASAEVLLNEAEIAATLTHGPWPPAMPADPSNRVSGNSQAIALGRALFHAPVLSRDGAMTCATCHQPERGFTDGLPRARGRETLDRNTQSLWNLGLHRWFGWVGATDNLWAQSLAPIVTANEMGHDAMSLRAALSDSAFAAPYAALFGAPRMQAPEVVLVNVGKSLAAYQETLVTSPTPFDAFRDALAAGDTRAAARYPQAAQRGLQLFVGRGNCALCHAGPGFSNGEFHDAGVPYFITDTRVDQGRFGAVEALAKTPFTLAGAHSDDPDRTGAWAVETLRPSHADFGIFRVPGLRNVARTAPYMHDGSLADLTAVVSHYNDIDMERMHSDGEALLQPLGLTQAEIGDLVAFLQTLSTDDP